MKVGDLIYRYDDVSYSHADYETGEHSYSTLAVELSEFEVVRVTSCGAWIVTGPRAPMESILGTRRFVLANARKRFAWPTKELAAESFRARKAKQIRIYQARIDRAERALVEMDKLAKEAA